MCEAMGVSRSGYYAYKKKAELIESPERAKIRDAIIHVYQDEHGIPGSRKIADELQKSGELPSASRNIVAKIMSQVGISGAGSKKFKVATTVSNPSHVLEPNVLDQNFDADKSNGKWVTGITYVMLADGTWCYLTIVLDLCSRRIIGWEVTDHMQVSPVKGALVKAINQRQPKSGLLHHSGRGSQCASHEYCQALKDSQMVSSMSRKACCYDNAVAERFFRSLKVEWLYDRICETPKDAMYMIGFYIDSYYNTKRKHASLNNLSPVAFEQAY